MADLRMRLNGRNGLALKEKILFRCLPMCLSSKVETAQGSQHRVFGTQIGRLSCHKMNYEDVDALLSIIETQPLVVEKSFDYVFSCLLNALGTKKFENGQVISSNGNGKPEAQTKELTVKAIRKLLALCNTKQPSAWTLDHVLNLMHHFAIILNPNPSQYTPQSLQDELKLEIVSCLLYMFANSPPGKSYESYPILEGIVVQKIVSEEWSKLSKKASSAGLIAHIVTTLLDLSSEMEKNRTIRETSIQAIKQLCLRMNKKALGAFLPGITVSMAKIITGDYKQGQKITLAALDLLTTAIVLVLNDEDNRDILASSNSVLDSLRKYTVKDSPNATVKPKKVQGGSPLERDQDREWLQDTSEKLCGVFKLIFSKNMDAYHSKWKVRLALVHSASLIATRCTETLSNGLHILVNVLVVHMEDDYPQVSEASLQAISILRDKLPNNSLTLMKENLHKILNSLPRVIRSANNDVETLMSLRLVNGYITLVGPGDHMETLVNTSLQQISIALFQLLNMDLYDVKSMEDTSLKASITYVDSNNANMASNNVAERTQPLQTAKGYPKKIFKLFRSEKVYKSLIKTCRLLGYYGNTTVLVDHFLEILRENQSGWQKQAVLVTNEVILGAAGYMDGNEGSPMENRLTSSQLRYICEEYLNLLDKPTSNLISVFMDDYIAQKPLKVEELHENKLLLSLVIEGIGNIATTLGSKFDELLMICLYPLAEKLGDSSAIVSQSAWTTLQRIARACGYTTASELILKNTDYVVDTIIHHMNHLDEYPTTPQLLKGVLEHTDESILPLLEDTLDSVFNSLDSHSHTIFTHIFLRILYNIVDVFFKQIADKETKLTEEDFKNRSLDKQYGTHSTTRIEDKDKPFAVRILEKAQHFISSQSREIRLLVLEIFELGIPVLSHAENGTLLPTINTLWPALVRRFVDKEKVVVMKSFQVVETMCKHCKGFLSGRFAADLWPVLKSTLSVQSGKLQPTSLKYLLNITSEVEPQQPADKVFQSGEKFTMAFKVHKAALSCLTTVCSYLDLNENTIREIEQVAKIFLSSKQAQELQEEALELFKRIGKTDTDEVWNLMHRLRGTQITTNDFPRILVGTEDSREHKMYDTNAGILLHYLQHIKETKATTEIKTNTANLVEVVENLDEELTVDESTEQTL